MLVLMQSGLAISTAGCGSDIGMKAEAKQLRG